MRVRSVERARDRVEEMTNEDIMVTVRVSTADRDCVTERDDASDLRTVKALAMAVETESADARLAMWASTTDSACVLVTDDARALRTTRDEASVWEMLREELRVMSNVRVLLIA